MIRKDIDCLGDQEGYRLVGDLLEVAWLRSEIIEEVAAIEVLL